MENSKHFKKTSGILSRFIIINIIILVITMIAAALSVFLFFDNENMPRLIFYTIVIGLFIVYVISVVTLSYKLIIKPFKQFIRSLEQINTNKKNEIFGLQRHDEFGVLANTIHNFMERLDYYNHDLEIKINEKSQALLNAKNEIESQHRTLTESLNYSAKIQRHLIPSENIFKSAFSDYSIIWKPRDIVGGDIYWIKRFDEGTVLCVCDCTGHGTAGALLTMIVISSLESIVKDENYKDTAQVLYELDKRFLEVFHLDYDKEEKDKFIDEGCTLAVLFIENDGSVTISSGRIHVFFCDGKEVIQIKGQKVYIGEGKLNCKEDVNMIRIPPNPDNKFYIATDGLYDQIGGERRLPFGYARMKEIILEHHGESQTAISEKIRDAFEKHRGNERLRDDVQLITFKF